MNGLVRPEEQLYLHQQQAAITAQLATASLQLDAIRIIVTT